ncbi:hypothetical protein [Promicromonospora sukumoe]|uniref:hypothetical protein n=1 Tax=Promicromonospora sukumoe TaxID=88382 RepID=UPI0036621C71
MSRADDAGALDRTEQLLRSAPPGTVEQVHVAAFERLTPAEREAAFARLSAGTAGTPGTPGTAGTAGTTGAASTAGTTGAASTAGTAGTTSTPDDADRPADPSPAALGRAAARIEGRRRGALAQVLGTDAPGAALSSAVSSAILATVAGYAASSAAWEAWGAEGDEEPPEYGGGIGDFGF